MSEIVVIIRDCKNPKCGHDRSSHYQSQIMVWRQDWQWDEDVRPMNCLARGCDCTRFRSGDAHDQEWVQHKDVYDRNCWATGT